MSRLLVYCTGNQAHDRVDLGSVREENGLTLYVPAERRRRTYRGGTRGSGTRTRPDGDVTYVFDCPACSPTELRRETLRPLLGLVAEVDVSRHRIWGRSH